MTPRTISASPIKLERWNKSKKISEGVGVELSASGLHCVCFDTTKAAEISAQREISSDLLSTVIPANLTLVKNPYGNTSEAYRGKGLVPVLQGSNSVATYFVDGILSEAEIKEAGDQLKDLAVADPCCGTSKYEDNVTRGGSTSEEDFAARDNKSRGGGRTCSKLFFQSETSSVPLTFHLKLDDVWNGGQSPVRGGNGKLQKGMDHFLIPSKAPGNSVVWLAFPRSEDPEKNYTLLKQWDRSTHKFAAFSGAMYTSDTLKITIVLDASPA